MTLQLVRASINKFFTNYDEGKVNLKENKYYAFVEIDFRILQNIMGLIYMEVICKLSILTLI